MITRKMVKLLVLVGGNDKKGLCVIKKSKKDEWNNRLKILEEQINYWINPVNTINKTIETIQLFYDI